MMANGGLKSGNFGVYSIVEYSTSCCYTVMLLPGCGEEDGSERVRTARAKQLLSSQSETFLAAKCTND